MRAAPGQSPRGAARGDRGRREPHREQVPRPGSRRDDRTDFRTWERKGVQRRRPRPPPTCPPCSACCRARRTRSGRSCSRSSPPTAATARSTACSSTACSPRSCSSSRPRRSPSRRRSRSPRRRRRPARRPSGRPTSSVRSTSTCCSRRGSTRADALAAASIWSGGRSRTVRADGRTCVARRRRRVDAIGARAARARPPRWVGSACRRAWRRCAAPAAGCRCDRVIRVPTRRSRRPTRRSSGRRTCSSRTTSSRSRWSARPKAARAAAAGRAVRGARVRAVAAAVGGARTLRGGHVRRRGPRRDQRCRPGGADRLRSLSRRGTPRRPASGPGASVSSRSVRLPLREPRVARQVQDVERDHEGVRRRLIDRVRVDARVSGCDRSAGRARPTETPTFGWLGLVVGRRSRRRRLVASRVNEYRSASRQPMAKF